MEQNMTSIRIVAAALVACFAGAPALAQGDSTLTLADVESAVLARSPALLAATNTAIAARARAEGAGA